MSARRLVVTGREGQVATSLRRADAGERGFEVVAVGRPGLDLADPAGIGAALRAARPDIVVNAAAYTAVDRAEDEPDLAHAVNAQGAGAVAEAARAMGVPVIQISTDYVFPGDLDRPYREDDPTGPIGVYGRTKLEGERLVAAAQPDHAVLRTAWVHAPHGANFVRTMLRLAGDRDRLRVVGDQHGCPTHADDIAAGILAVADHALADRGDWRGVTHLVSEGETTWAGLARAVFEVSAAHGGPAAEVEAIATADYPTKAARPANSRLDVTRLRETFGHRPPHWRDGVERCVREALAA